MNNQFRDGFHFYALAAISLFALAILLAQSSHADDKASPKPLLEKWEKDVRKLMEKNERLKALGKKYPLVLIHSNEYRDLEVYRQAYSFFQQTNDSRVHRQNIQIFFDGSIDHRFSITNLASVAVNLLVNLGPGDFEKNPDPKNISIDDSRVCSTSGIAVEGHVYLERITDDKGRISHVLFEVVHVDKDALYMAFIWRKLPEMK